MALPIRARSPNRLGHQADIGSFAATRAGAGEFEQGLEELNVLDLVEGERGAVGFGNARGRSPSWRASASRSGIWGAMLMALRLTSHLSLTGQTSTQRPQPVQSSARPAACTCVLEFLPARLERT